MARYVVTGGAGFIGSHLVDALLACGHQVHVVDDLSTGSRKQLDPRAELIQACVTDAFAMQNAMQGAAGCFHLAAVTASDRYAADWRGTHHINLSGMVTVLDAARHSGNVPVVYASTAEVYGTQRHHPIAETSLPAPHSPAAADKLGAEFQAQAAFHAFGLPNLGFRLFNVYGPRQDPDAQHRGVVAIFARQLAARAPLALHGDGHQTRDFIYVGDVIRFLLRGMTLVQATPQATIINACTGRATSVRELARLLENATGAAADIVTAPPRTGDIRMLVGDPTLSEHVLGLRARIPLEDGLTWTFGAHTVPHAA